VVLIVVEMESFRRHRRFERLIGIGKIGKAEHGCTPDRHITPGAAFGSVFRRSIAAPAFRRRAVQRRWRIARPGEITSMRSL